VLPSCWLSEREKKEWVVVAYVCVPCFELGSELVEIGALARDQCNIIPSLGKEASDGAQRKVNNHASWLGES
jgi:hypothetical protein